MTVLPSNRGLDYLQAGQASGKGMKVTKNFPWFETVAFLVILLLATASSLVPHDRSVAANQSTTQAPQ